MGEEAMKSSSFQHAQMTNEANAAMQQEFYLIEDFRLSIGSECPASQPCKKRHISFRVAL
jgi:hypothetical protein